MKARYVNPYTDFGFKKLFGEEANTPEQLAQYEESLKIYRDLKGVVDTSYEEGKAEGKIEGKKEGKKEGIKETAKRMLLNDFSVEQVITATGLTEKEVKALMS